MHDLDVCQREVDTDDVEAVLLPSSDVEAWAGADIHHSIPPLLEKSPHKHLPQANAELTLVDSTLRECLGLVVGDEVGIESHGVNLCERPPTVQPDPSGPSSWASPMRMPSGPRM